MPKKALFGALLGASLLTSACAEPTDGWELFDLMAEGLMGNWRGSDPAHPKSTRFSFIGNETTIKEASQGTVTMYHCKEIACTTLKASRYGPQTPPEFVANLASCTPQRFVFECDTANALCGSETEHIHAFTYELSSDGNALTATYETWVRGKPEKISLYRFKKVHP